MSYYSAEGDQFACVDLEESIGVIDPEHCCWLSDSVLLIGDDAGPFLLFWTTERWTKEPKFRPLSRLFMFIHQSILPSVPHGVSGLSALGDLSSGEGRGHNC